jgi:serine/threonine protein phosphatase PrpC
MGSTARTLVDIRQATGGIEPPEATASGKGVTGMASGDLEARIGLATETGLREENEDFAATYLGTAAERAARGAVMAVADGVGGAPGGREAAETAVRGFIDGYYAQPEGLSVEDAATRTAQAINGWIHAIGRRDPGLRGMATTLSALILRGREAHVAHVGDSRIYRLRGDELLRLTVDHNPPEPELSHILVRGIGIDETVEVDLGAHELEVGDRFLLVTDGVHGVLADSRIQDILAGESDPEAAARRLVAAALKADSLDNVTALVADVTALPGGE